MLMPYMGGTVKIGCCMKTIQIILFITRTANSPPPYLNPGPVPNTKCNPIPNPNRQRHAILSWRPRTCFRGLQLGWLQLFLNSQLLHTHTSMMATLQVNLGKPGPVAPWFATCCESVHLLVQTKLLVSSLTAFQHLFSGVSCLNPCISVVISSLHYIQHAQGIYVYLSWSPYSLVSILTVLWVTSLSSSFQRSFTYPSHSDNFSCIQLSFCLLSWAELYLTTIRYILYKTQDLGLQF